MLQALVNPPDICVSVSQPELIHPAAQLRNSILGGRIKVGKNSIIKEAYLSGGDISIGRNTSLWGPNIDIYCWLNPVTVGSFCSIARNVSMQEYNHRIDRCSSYFFAGNVFGGNQSEDMVSRGPIVIGNDVWIGSQVVVVSGAVIGDGAVIGANSVVTGTIPPYAIAAGSPAKVIKYRFDQEIVDRLLALKWWEWDDDRISRNREFFLNPMSHELLDQVKD
ncbi:CatB-related O-acetyltransferase [Geomonas sp. Red32]|uniref:CatB-related O-acetyltransferase n=1 Tax=Geomonas sp. Red32 TaxID=2912856 RepID=UPI00202D0B5C|nr:CatB-related O-acetyltransferase [Geomonas sp. Red32]MCM0083487.1 CatB-related O-acetyltransferase [Geomonas sp. Red32]